ncbi:MAG TPA: ABC transporter permease [Bryobacteraceae bacterium]|nr:ABC transporter permease [Bryobacteraceae bacterium]
MSALRRFAAAVSALFRRESLDSDFNEEMDAHIALAVDDKVRRGMTPEAARKAALAELGGVTASREEHRDARGLPFLETLVQDIRYSLRALRRDAGLAVFATLIVSLGIGAGATVFSVVHTLLLRELPFASANDLVWIANNNGEGLSDRTVQVSQLQELQRSNHSFSGVAAYFAFYSIGDFRFSRGSEPERLTAVPVTRNFFEVLGVNPQIGRQFTEAEAAFNGPLAVMLSHAFWKSHLGSDPAVAGRAITLNDRTYTIAGVLPASFDFGAIFAPSQRIDLFYPFPLVPETSRWGNTLSMVGRLRPGVTVEAARAELAVHCPRVNREHPEWNAFNPYAAPLREHISGKLRPAMYLLSGAVFLVMLIVCANLSNLLLSRATVRGKEIAIRAALGAGRGRLIRQMLVESMILSSAGALLGLLAAVAMTRFLAGLETQMPLLSQVRVDWSAVGFTTLLALATGIGFGLLPALRVSSMELQSAMKSGERGSSGGREGGLLRSALVSSEVALACLLLVGSGLMIRSFLRVLDVDLGFQPSSTITIRIDPGRNFPDAATRWAYFRDAIQRVNAASGVDYAGITDSLPLGTNRSWGAPAKGVVYTRETFPDGFVRIIGGNYFQSMGIPVVKGRDLAMTDNAGSKNVIVINETLARRLWPGEDPIGKVMRPDKDREVVGVVRDVRHLALESGAGNEFYIPFWQTNDFGSVNLVIRGRLAQQDLEAVVRSELRAMDPALPLSAFRSLQDIVDRSVSPRKLIVTILGGFAGMALLLASLGIYGVISYSVTQRRKELGIRMALGASGAAVRGAVLWQTLRLVLLGLAVGLTLAWAGARALSVMLFGVTSSDPVTFFAAVVLLLAVALLAGFVPARRASMLNPLDSLRME